MLTILKMINPICHRISVTNHVINPIFSFEIKLFIDRMTTAVFVGVIFKGRLQKVLTLFPLYEILVLRVSSCTCRVILND